MPELRPVVAVEDQLSAQSKKLDALPAGQQALASQLTAIQRTISANTTIDPDRLYSRREAANHYAVSTRTIDRWIQSGRLDVVNTGRRIRVYGRSIVELDRWQKQSAVGVLRL